VPAAAPAARAKRSFPWVTLIVGVVAVVAIVVLAVMYVSAASDRDDAEDALADTQSALAAAEDDLADSEAAVGESEAALATAQSDLADTEAALAESEAARAEAEAAQADAEAAQADAEAAQADAEAALDEQQQRADDYEAAAADFLAISFGEGLGLDEEDAQCVGQGLVDSMGPDALASLASAAQAATPGSDVAAFGVELMRVAEDCGIDPEAFDDEPSASDAFAYGDDPALDALYDQCAAGDAVSCDTLYVESPQGSEYEQFAGTCGNRFEYSDTEYCEGRL
jgi:hypothetical protein